MNTTGAAPRTIVSTVAASAVLAVLALVLFVLPAEHGIDPTGVGRWLGITGMSGYSVQALSVEPLGYARDTVEFPLAPFESVEYKYELSSGQALLYRWRADGDLVFDFHSEEQGTDPEDSVSFSTGRAASQQGTYVAPYDGVHGWFWENRGTREVLVRLDTVGFYRASITYSSGGEFRRELGSP